MWQTTKLPDGKTIMPGCVTHCTDLVERPQLVAQRIIRYANLVGKENVVAGTDCGIGTRVGHGEIAWAKLAAWRRGPRWRRPRSSGDRRRRAPLNRSTPGPACARSSRGLAG